MPELPEVEYARQSLERWLKGATLERVRVVDERILDEGESASRILKALAGRRVTAVERRGKWLRIAVDSGVDQAVVFSHLGMTGKWVRALEREPVRFEKIRFEVRRRAQSGLLASVAYVDPRLFGRFVFAREDIAAWKALGPDPLHDGVDVAVLRAGLARRKIAVKPALLDQSLLAGIGNIQATEALWFARVDPRKKCPALTRAEVAAIAKGIRRSIRETLALQEGPSIQYIEEAGAENPFTIYGHGGEPCPRCKTRLAKIVLAGRGTVFCPECQT